MSVDNPIRRFLLARAASHPKGLVASACRRFRVTRPAVHRHLDALLKEGKIGKTGSRRTASYFIASRRKTAFTVGIRRAPVAEDAVWRGRLIPLMAGLPSNVVEICHYGFTEMFNNAIEHSGGRSITVHAGIRDASVTIEITDDGIGILNKLARTFALTDPRECALLLSKGKVTSSPEKHSGEGIFFTSRAFDEFSLTSAGIVYTRVNSPEPDWFITSAKDAPKRGTIVQLKIAMRSPRTLKEIFAAYTDPETFRFDTTEVAVKLAVLPDESYVSRSQARRLIVGLDKFEKIILDFSGVKNVGQAFVDEVFRVFATAHPSARIKYRNANPDVDFMIRRGVATGDVSLPIPHPLPHGH